MSFDQSAARCSFCGKHSFEVQRMIAGPGAAYLCNECLQLCNEIMSDPAPFSEKALEMASRPPIVIAAPSPRLEGASTNKASNQPQRTITLEIEQKLDGMTLILHQMLYFEDVFELQYLWIRPPFPSGFAFVPRIVFSLQDSIGTTWSGEQSGMLLARPDLSNGPGNAIYQGSARFRPLPGDEARSLTIRAIDPLAAFNEPPLPPWNFTITLL
jgi:hypothetical protein